MGEQTWLTSGKRRRASATRFGAFRYFVLFFINTLALSPISRTKDPNLAFAISEANRQYSLLCFSETKESLLLQFAVLHVLRNDSLKVSEGVLCFGEGNSVPSLIDLIFSWVPFEIHSSQITIYSYILTAIPTFGINCNIMKGKTCGRAKFSRPHFVYNCHFLRHGP